MGQLQRYKDVAQITEALELSDKAYHVMICAAAKLPYKSAEAYLKRYGIEINSESTYKRELRKCRRWVIRNNKRFTISGFEDAHHGHIQRLLLAVNTCADIMANGHSEHAKVQAARTIADVELILAAFEADTQTIISKQQEMRKNELELEKQELETATIKAQFTAQNLQTRALQENHAEDSTQDT